MSGRRFAAFLLLLAILAIFNGFALWSIYLLYADGNFGLMVTMVILTLLIDLIALNPKGYPYRYMIPAMVLLFILTLYPMYYTFRTAFTNYGTGHLFTRQQAIQKLLSDYFYIPEKPQEYEFSIYIQLKDYNPTDNFITVLQSKESGEVFAVPRPQAINRDATGNITLATAKMIEIKGDTFSIGGVNYSISRSPTGSILAIRSDTGERYVYFYSPQDQSTRPNASFYFSEIRGVWLRNAEFTDSEGNQVRLFPNSLYTTFATTERKYALRAETVFSAGRAVQETVVYNRQTGRKLVEEGGFFYDFDENGNDITVEGYISDVGFWNFVRMFRDPKISKPFFQVFGWTFTWAGLSVFFSFTIGLALAMTLNDRRLKGKKIYRTLMIIPWAVPAFISALVWRNGFFNETYGVLNRFIVQGLFGLEPIKWLNDAFWAKVSVLIVNTWLGFPYMMTVSLGALQSIPEEFYEASSIDGATRLQRFKKITFPLLMVTVAPLLVGSFAFNFNNFTGIYLVTQGGPAIVGASTPAGATDILISYTFKLAFEGRGQDFGFASAISIIIFIIVAGFSWINFKLSGSFEEVSR